MFSHYYYYHYKLEILINNRIWRHTMHAVHLFVHSFTHTEFIHIYPIFGYGTRRGAIRPPNNTKKKRKRQKYRENETHTNEMERKKRPNSRNAAVRCNRITV